MSLLQPFKNRLKHLKQALLHCARSRHEPTKWSTIRLSLIETSQISLNEIYFYHKICLSWSEVGKFKLNHLYHADLGTI
jgi:hypothetical protein